MLSRKNGSVPSHPYPARTTYKQSNYGLYGGTHIQYGNKVSEKGKNKSRRFWRPNIQTKRLWSEALSKYVRLRVQARVLRTIDKVGGLDEYLLGEKAQRIKELGVGGWALRWSLVHTPAVQERWRRERERLGVPQMKMKARLRLRDEVQNLRAGDLGKRQSGAEPVDRGGGGRGGRTAKSRAEPLHQSEGTTHREVRHDSKLAKGLGKWFGFLGF